MKRLLTALMALMLWCSLAQADVLPLGGPAPYPPVASAFGEDGMSYDDGTLSITIETDVVYDTNVYFAYVTLTDVSQLRTALAAPYPSKTIRPVNVMAAEQQAVLAINGDFFSYHNKGVVVRSGEILRQQPESTRDTLIIDDNGDFVILTENTRAEWEDYLANGTGCREAFCFGPALIIDGEVQTFKPGDKVSCGAPTPAQRMVFCQLDTLQYMIFVCEGPEQDKKAGLTMNEVVEQLVARGVKHAYNLDGGNSATLMLGDQRINDPNHKFRQVGDMIYFATLVSGE
ncbi:MAG: phosphodiester glycosidase family protein [Aristaeellaceae bacterium]